MTEAPHATWYQETENRYLVFRAGKLAFVWPDISSWIWIVPYERGFLTNEDQRNLLVEAPPGLRQEPGPFAEFCRDYLGIPEAIKEAQGS